MTATVTRYAIQRVVSDFSGTQIQPSYVLPDRFDDLKAVEFRLATMFRKYKRLGHQVARSDDDGLTVRHPRMHTITHYSMVSIQLSDSDATISPTK